MPKDELTNAQKERKNLYLLPQLLPELEARAEPDGRGYNLSAVVNESLSRYFALLKEARETARCVLAPAQVALCADRLNGTLVEAWSLPFALLDCVDTQAAEKWNVDKKQTQDVLESLSLAQTAAVVDAVERFWTAVGRGEERDAMTILED